VTIPHTETKSGIVYGQAQRYNIVEWAERAFGTSAWDAHEMRERLIARRYAERVAKGETK
jgi:hypothetical protein